MQLHADPLAHSPIGAAAGGLQGATDAIAIAVPSPRIAQFPRLGGIA